MYINVEFRHLIRKSSSGTAITQSTLVHTPPKLTIQSLSHNSSLTNENEVLNCHRYRALRLRSLRPPNLE